MTAPVVGLIILLACSFLLNLWLIVRVWRPVRELARRTVAISNGDLNALDQPCDGIAEMTRLRVTMASMAGHVQRAQSETVAYRSALTAGQEAERERIARELHDETVQSFIAIAQGIDLGLTWVDSDRDRALALLRQTRTQSVEAVADVRRLIANLRPPALAELGLIAALHMLAPQLGPTNLRVHVRGAERRLPETVELTLFRVVQEAAHNAQRHGQAAVVDVYLDYRRSEILVSVVDNGLGFVPPLVLSTLLKQGHFGLVGLVERLHHLGGSAEVISQPGQGTTITARLPVEPLDVPPGQVRDPVCGVVFPAEQAFGSAIYQGIRYYFCCPVCRGAFQHDPHIYLPQDASPSLLP